MKAFTGLLLVPFFLAGIIYQAAANAFMHGRAWHVRWGSKK